MIQHNKNNNRKKKREEKKKEKMQMQKKMQLKDLPYDIFAGHLLPMLDHASLCCLIQVGPSLLSDDLIVKHIVPRFETSKQVYLMLKCCPSVIPLLQQRNHVFEFNHDSLRVNGSCIAKLGLPCRQHNLTNICLSEDRTEIFNHQSWLVNGLIQGYTPDLPAKIETFKQLKLEIWAENHLVHRNDKEKPAVVLTQTDTGKVLYEVYYQYGKAIRKQCSRSLTALFRYLDTLCFESNYPNQTNIESQLHPVLINILWFTPFVNANSNAIDRLLEMDDIRIYDTLDLSCVGKPSLKRRIQLN